MATARLRTIGQLVSTAKSRLSSMKKVSVHLPLKVILSGVVREQFCAPLWAITTTKYLPTGTRIVRRPKVGSVDSCVISLTRLPSWKRAHEMRVQWSDNGPLERLKSP